MAYLGLLLLFVALAYLTTSYTAYREIREKNIKVRFTINNVIFFFMIPIRVSSINLKMGYRFYRDGRRKEARLLFTLATYKISSGIAVYLELMAHLKLVSKG